MKFSKQLLEVSDQILYLIITLLLGSNIPVLVIIFEMPKSNVFAIYLVVLF